VVSVYRVIYQRHKCMEQVTHFFLPSSIRDKIVMTPFHCLHFSLKHIHFKISLRGCDTVWSGGFKIKTAAFITRVDHASSRFL